MSYSVKIKGLEDVNLTTTKEGMEKLLNYFSGKKLPFKNNYIEIKENISLKKAALKKPRVKELNENS